MVRKLPRSKRVQPLTKPNSKIRDFLKHAGPQLPSYTAGSVFSWRSPEESPKVATYRSRRMAALNSLPHLIPLGAALVLLVLFWTSYWTGGTSDNGTSLQFAAKVHELLMQASLIDVLLHVIRYQATSGYLPLGALSGAARAPQLSYLWSLDFMSAVMSPRTAYSTRRKVAFVLSASGLLLMTAVVGPSSAVLMIPRPEMPHVNGTVTRYVNAMRFDGILQMRTLESTITADGRQIDMYSWESDDLAIGSGDIPSSIRTAYFNATANNFSSGVATIPTILSAKRLITDSPLIKPNNTSQYDGHLIARAKSANSRWTTYTSHPVVMARCSETIGIENVTNVYYFRDNGSQDLLPDAIDLFRAHLSKYVNRSGGDARYDTIPPLWMPSPEGSKSLLALFLSYLFPSDDQKLNVCTMTSFWHKKLTVLVPVDMGTMIRLPEGIEAEARSDMAEIALDINFMSSIGTLCKTCYVYPGLLALFYADVLSWIPAYHNGTSFEFDKIREESSRTAMSGSNPLDRFEIIETIDGYGYGATDISIRLSVAVMVTYCLITVFYVAYIIITGHTSIAWDSATELIMLALQSKELECPRHVSAGLGSMKTFQQSVGIRVSTVSDDETGLPRERLELVFKESEAAKDRGLTKVERGTAY